MYPIYATGKELLCPPFSCYVPPAMIGVLSAGDNLIIFRVIYDTMIDKHPIKPSVPVLIAHRKKEQTPRGRKGRPDGAYS